MKLLHIVGRQNHGKTTLVAELVDELSRRGLRVGTIKHSKHAHELDTPGKDSHRHRVAGARPAAIISEKQLAVHLARASDEDPFLRLFPFFSECDLVLVEGGIDRRPAQKIEVWRAEVGTAPLASERDDILAVVSDGPVAVATPVWPRRPLPPLADRVLSIAQPM